LDGGWGGGTQVTTLSQNIVSASRNELHTITF
jgi:hypothetical protein